MKRLMSVVMLVAVGLLARPTSAVVPSETRSVTYSCSTWTNAIMSYSYDYTVYARADLVVTRTTSAGTTYTLTLDDDYKVVLASDYSYAIITALAKDSLCMATTDTITITRTVAYTQTSSLSRTGPYDPKTIQRMVDRGTMQAQQARDAVTAEASARSAADTKLDAHIAAVAAGTLDLAAVTGDLTVGGAVTAGSVSSTGAVTAGSVSSTGAVTAGSVAAPSGAALTARGQLVAADAGTDVTVGSTVTRTAGSLFKVANNATSYFTVGYGGNITSPGTNTWTGVNYFSQWLMAPSGSALTARGYLAAANTGTDVTVGSAQTRTAGKLFSIRNNATDYLTVDYAGGIVSPGSNSWTGTNAFTGTTTFNTALPTSTVTPTSSTQLVTKGYVDTTGNTSSAIYKFSAASSAIATTTATLLNFDTLVYDPGSAVTTGTAWKYTAATAGMYMIDVCTAYTALTSTAMTTRYILYVNGSASRWGNVKEYSATIGTFAGAAQCETMLVRLAAADYVQMYIRHTNSSSLTLTADTTTTPGRIEITRIPGTT